MISLTCLKISMTALAILLVIMFVDDANGTYYSRSPLWIAAPGAIAGITFIAAGVIGIIALIWGL